MIGITNLLMNTQVTKKILENYYFASLVLIENIHIGDTGNHNVCVCAQHENMIFKFYAITREIKYRS